ncbi:DUF1294 domain-containing protein [bacterium]|nr:MAG: DUF1294 domain-containing protein [bacterium]
MVADAGKRYTGEIVEWSDEKRCGFIAPVGGNRNDSVVFLPIEALMIRRKSPKIGDIVNYEIESIAQSPNAGRLRTTLRAREVLFEGQEYPLPVDSRGDMVLAFIGIVHLIAQCVATALFPQTLWLLVAGFGFSFLSFGLYAWDKRASKESRPRVPEIELQLFSLMGGWPGAAVAQSFFRHKTRKRSFRLIFFLALLLNMVLTYLAYGYYVTRFH